ncbi:hypothetical protein NY2A_B324L [Paramecium bursaria Chlorella virus NY2A]|uniref:Uncharacterized protein B324L n=1 Tax=Paramecium bursaria Chlorella virus NY2A TaxID=46021 RepID=A7IWJ9_PBCVN|nr:hypothetical protein NY2A_B324L [Paramecium bursaria Chlorella virus NY2A]ABT14723.1 hypothetical protein NY2A_B324L [Paramecium bursaria Chlorella virus NY2A]AGE54197.1 hypothetical protein PBCVIL52s1_356L [Paramecium bursaria Chlorella virus IL-5-2s1]
MIMLFDTYLYTYICHLSFIHIDTSDNLSKMLCEIQMMFVPISDKESKSGLTYEISKEHWTVISITKTGTRRVLKPNKSGRVKIAGKLMLIYNVAELAGLNPKSWPDDDRRWYEHDMTSDIYRYRQFYDGQVQKMDRHGDVSYQNWTKTPDGYYTVSIAGKDVRVHQLMGTTSFIPKPKNMPKNWTIHHIDNVKSNNHAWNLEWASPKKQREEQRSMEQHRIVSCPVIGTALRDVMLKDGTMIRKGEDTQIFESATEAADAIVCGCRSLISRCINNCKLKSHAKFTWRTPPSDEDLVGEVFKSIGKNDRSERLVSIFGRFKQAFHNGYTKIMFAKDTLSEREQEEKDSYPYINIDTNTKQFHRVVVEKFFGTLPKTIVIDGKKHRLVVDHIDDDRQNARLDNLQLLTQRENMQKRYMKEYTTSVASAIKGKYERSYKTRIDAIDHVKDEYPKATLDELNEYVNTHNEIYGRSWIRAHFETSSKCCVDVTRVDEHRE